MKLPAFQFYPADWRKDPGVQSLSYHDRGIWFEIMCLMHESDRRGVLLLNGLAMPEDALARLLGLDNQTLTTAITTLLTYGVASREPETNALYCRRMVRDEDIRKIRQEAGKLGGNPLLLKQKPTTRVKQNSTPSSSTSSSSSNSQRESPVNPPVTPAKSVPTVSEEEARLNEIEGLIIQSCNLTFLSPAIERQLAAATATISQTKESIARIKEFCDSRTKVQALNYIAQNFMQWVGNANREQVQQPAKSKTYCGACVRGWVMPTSGDRTATRCQCVNQGKEQEVMV